MENKSKFSGGLIGLWLTGFFAGLVIIITGGIATPWAICWYVEWVIGNTQVDGRQLVFDGKGSQLFGKFIIWYLLTIVTLGIYGFWTGIKMMKWTVSHIHFADEVPAVEE